MATAKYTTLKYEDYEEDYPFIVWVIEKIHNKHKNDRESYTMTDYFQKLQDHLIHYRGIPSERKKKDKLYKRIKKAAHEFKVRYNVIENVAMLNAINQYKNDIVSVIKQVIMDTSLDTEESSIDTDDGDLISFSTDEEEDLIKF